MESSQKFSNPPSSLNISKRTEDGSSSSASTPSEDYKTPSLEHVTIPGFDFGIREIEPEAPSKLLQEAGVPQCLVSETEMAIFPQECIGVPASVLPKSLNFSQVSSPSVTICGTKSPTRPFGAGHGLIVNGTNAKMSTSKHCSESSVIPLMRSPPTTSRQVKKTSFAASPNQTTWLEETVQRGSSLEHDQSKVTCDVMRSQSAELSGIRHKLEERRKQIENEKKKMEMQWSKQRQQVGKEAFIQVVTRQHFGSSSQNDMKIRMQMVRPAYYGEVSDRKHVLITEQERQSPKPLLCDSETDRGSALHPVANSLSRTENVKEFGMGKLLTENSSDSIGSNKKTMVSLKENAHVKTNKVSERKVSSPMNASAGYHSDVSEYGTSLDRLNSSLTELQGEIMRLSLQQDQIKSLVGSDLEPALESTRSFSTPVSSQKAKDQFFLFLRNTSGTICGTRQPTVSSVDNSVVCGVNGSSVSHVSGQNSTSLFGSSTATKFSGTKTVESPLGFVSPGHGSPLRGELLPSGTNPMNAHYPNQQSTYPHYYPMPRVPYLDGIGYSMPMTNLVHPSVSQIPVSQQGSVDHPIQNFNPHAGLWHSVGPVHRLGDGDKVTGDTTMTELMRTQQIPTSGLSNHDDAINDKASDVAVPLKSPRMQSPLLLKSGLHCSDSKNYDHQNIPTSSAFLSSPDNRISSMPSSLRAEYKPLNIPLSENETAPSSAPSETFFMVLESDLPRRPKPVLSTNYGKKETLSTAVPDSYSIPATNKVGIAVDGKTAPGSVLCAAPSVGFVVGEEGSMNQELHQEVEKKRQQMAEMHQRRQEELELKKQKIEIEQQTKREVLRLKQEKDFEKKAKEKVRREEIFQSYLQRKTEEDGSEDDSKMSLHGTGKQPVKSRAKLHRLKSQPPPFSDINLNERAQGFSTPSSVGGRLTDPRNGSPNSDLSRSSEHLNILTTNFEHLEARLAFGNLGQQTPSVTDRIPRFLSSSSDGGSDAGIGGGQVPDNYAGPKLFVKPSQKSNRHIIVNAIKDCCLAGLVNRDIKNKVVEEINKSDSKHFVILFRDAGMQYRGLYTYNPEREDVFKIHGVGPSRLLDKTMEKFYKYNSGAKNFTEVTSTKHLSATIDAITILGVLWQKKASTGQSKRPI